MRLLAQTEICSSNSMIDSWWRVIKHHWLYLNTLDTSASVRKLVAFYVQQHNNAMADDVDRYLAGDAVVACPPSTGYLLRKFAGRNKAVIATAFVVSLSLVVGTIGTTFMAIKAWKAQQQTLAALTSLRKEVVERAFLTIMSGDTKNCEQAIESARLVEADDATVKTLQGLAALYKGDLESALDLAQEATESDPHHYAAWIARRLIYWSSGQNLMVRYQQTDEEQWNRCPGRLQQ